MKFHLIVVSIVIYILLIKDFFSKGFNFVKNKYFLTLMIFGIWMIIFDQSNFLFRVKSSSKLRELEKDKLHYIERIKTDSTQINELRSSKENLEKFARETYLMKKDDEDIYIITEEE
ncbi:septum formation initiator family protein [Bacteroidota bacterium]